MEKSFKYRIYPTDEQKELIAKTFGCCRFVYNHFLAMQQELYKRNNEHLSYYSCVKELTQLKKQFDWLNEVDSQALAATLKNLDTAFQNFFKYGKGYPKFKSKKENRHTYSTKNAGNGNVIQYYSEYCLKLPKLGLVKTRNHLVTDGRILNATVSQEPSGKYFVSLCCTDVDIQPLEKTGNQIGLDLGIKNYCTTSNGDAIPNPKYYRQLEKKIAKLQKELSKKTKDSKNYEKARIKLAKVYERISNQRKDFLNKLSTEFIRNNDTICLENLNIMEMLKDAKDSKNHELAKDINDASWFDFTEKLEYKAKWYGKQVIRIDRYYPSSQLCSNCGYKNENTKDLNLREWTCPNCGTYHDRDHNAAINILNQGLGITSQSDNNASLTEEI